MSVIDEVEIDPDVINVMHKIDAMAETQHSLSFTTVELTALSHAVGHTKTMLTKAMRQAPEEVVDQVSSMLTEAAVLERRIDTTLKAIYQEALGTTDIASVLEKVGTLRDEIAEKVGAPKRDGDSWGGQYL